MGGSNGFAATNRGAADAVLQSVRPSAESHAMADARGNKCDKYYRIIYDYWICDYASCDSSAARVLASDYDYT